MPKAETLYSAAKGIALNGEHLFSISDKPLAPASIPGSVRLYLRANFVRCSDGTHAVRRMTQERVDLAAEGISPRDLPSQHGYVTNERGEVTHWFAPNGLLYALTYLGRAGEELASEPHRMPG